MKVKELADNSEIVIPFIDEIEENGAQGRPAGFRLRAIDIIEPIGALPNMKFALVGIHLLPAPATGNISSRESAKREHTNPVGRKSKAYRKQSDLFEPGQKGVRSSVHIDRAVPPGLVIYCVGACEPNLGAGGWSFVVYRDGIEIRADCGGSDPTTNNIMELTGALRVMEWITEHVGGKNARLFGDSVYVVNGCNDWWHEWRRKGKNPEIANLDLWKELDAALTAVSITLEWCKGHVGIIGNERADELSLEGRETISASQSDPMDLIREQLDYSARGGWWQARHIDRRARNQTGPDLPSACGHTEPCPRHHVRNAEPI